MTTSLHSPTPFGFLMSAFPFPGVPFAFVLGALLLAASASAEIIVTEIMFNPQGSDRDSTGPSYTYNREWAEIFNTGAAAVDLTNWQFGDAQDNNWSTPFPAGTTLGAGQALIITGDADSFDSNWGPGINRIEVGAFPNQANSVGDGEAAAIRNAQGVIQDYVRYQDPVPNATLNNSWPTANGSDGNSIYLLPSALSAAANDIPTNWRPSSAGAYGARFTSAGGEGENHGSPGVVHTASQFPFAPTPGAAWSMVVFPDTQNYSKSSRDIPIFSQMTNWVVDHKDQYNIKVVLQEGDLVNNNDTENPTSGNQTGDQQWANARAAMGILDGHVPYIIALGNHDLGTTSAQNRDTQYNDYFQPFQNPLIDPAQGGILRGVQEPGRMENAYFEVNGPDGRNLLVFSLEFWPTQATVNWANQIAGLPQYADHTAVLLTHSYLNHNNVRLNNDGSSYDIGEGGDYHDGEHLWQELVSQRENFEMTFSGHVGGDGVGYLQSTGVNGNKVHQMLINSQFETNGGNGWFRLVEFMQDGKTVRVRTYSPFLDVYRTDSANDYYITLTQLPDLIADFEGDRDVDADDLADWMAGYGPVATAAQGDADGDGDADGADFLTWQRRVTSYASSTSSSAAVPEPAAMALFGCLAITMYAARPSWSGAQRP